MSPKTILSLFDYSGQWTEPFREAGHNVIALDIKTDPGLADVRNFNCAYFIEELGIEWVDAIIAAPPCTDFTVAGAQYWKRKDQDGTTAASVFLVEQVLRCVEFWKPDWWVIENPVGRLPALIPGFGRPAMHFDPCDYSGFIDLNPAEGYRLDVMRQMDGAGEFTAADVELVKRSNAYTKKTALWGNFEHPEKRRREPVKVCKAGSWLMKLGGNTAATKEARSDTPAGFAEAFYLANEWTPAKEEAYNAKREAEEGQ